MIEQSDLIVQGAERLCATLERIGDALIAVDVDTLLDTEETLEWLLAVVGRNAELDDRAALESLVLRGQTALLRCRRLGGAFTKVARSRLTRHTAVADYRRDRETNDAPPIGSCVQEMA